MTPDRPPFGIDHLTVVPDNAEESRSDRETRGSTDADE